MPSKQLHITIAKELQRRITSGALSQGDLLPSEAELCEEFAASRGPVRQAIASLRAEGLISSGRGRRSVVLGDSQSESFMSILSNYRWMKDHNLNPSSTMLWMARRPAPVHVAKALRIEPEDPVIFVSRVRHSDGKPLIVERQYFPLDVGKHVMAMDPEAESIHEELFSEGIDFDSCRRSIETVQANQEVADLLEIPVGTALNGSRLEAFDHSGTPVEYAEYLYPANFLGYTLTVVKGARTPIHTDLLLEGSTNWAAEPVNS